MPISRMHINRKALDAQFGPRGDGGGKTNSLNREKKGDIN